MKNTVSLPSVSTNKSRVNPSRRLITSIILWTAQVVIALMFLFAGGMKLVLPIALLVAQMPLPLPGLFVRFIGLAEFAGGLGLILPGLLRIRPMLTPLAAIGLLLDMIGATVYNLFAAQSGAAVVTVVLGLICVALACGRRSWFAR